MDTGDETYGFLTTDGDLQRGALAAHVTEKLRAAIMACQIPPGTMLDKARICARLGVSRAPVAEAFARLEAEGFVDILPQRGTVVTFLSIADVKELVFIRKALECKAVRVAAEKATPELIAALDANIDAQRAAFTAGDQDGFHRLDGAFHDLLVKDLSYRRIGAMIETARNTLSRARQMTNTPKRVADGISEHARIVEAIRKDDPQEAAEAMEDHLEGIVTEVRRLARERPMLFNDRCIIQKYGTIRRAPSP